VDQSESGFQNLIVTKKNRILVILLNFVKFGKIRYNSLQSNFDWRVCIVKNRKIKNRPNLLINRIELAEIQSNSSEFR
jgi:hypothetical protein